MDYCCIGILFWYQISFFFFVSKIESITKPKSHFKPKPQAFRTKHTDVHDSPFSNLTPIKEWRADIFMSAENKQTYMLSEEWQELRTLVFIRDKHTCQSCGSQTSLNCHHITYEDLGMETLDQLTTLCTTCHTALHKRLGYDRTTLYPIIKD